MFASTFNLTVSLDVHFLSSRGLNEVKQICFHMKGIRRYGCRPLKFYYLLIMLIGELSFCCVSHRHFRSWICTILNQSLFAIFRRLSLLSSSIRSTILTLTTTVQTVQLIKT